MASNKISTTKARSVAKALHRKSISRKTLGARSKITAQHTGTGSGAIRFRAARVLESLRSPAGPSAHTSKLRTSR